MTTERTTARRMRVLVVDDDQGVRRLLKSILERSGYACSMAGDAEEARAVLGKEKFAAVLTDMRMPGDSGLALARMVAGEHPGTAVVMVTGVDDPKLALTAFECGAVGFLLKPFEHSMVLFQLANAIRQSRLKAENDRLRDRH